MKWLWKNLGFQKKSPIVKVVDFCTTAAENVSNRFLPERDLTTLIWTCQNMSATSQTIKSLSVWLASIVFHPMVVKDTLDVSVLNFLTV